MTRLPLFFAAGLVAAPLALAADPVISDRQFKELHALVKAQPDEDVFDRIPWLTSLWEARKQAAEAGKPIMLWEMDGHPLGCV